MPTLKLFTEHHMFIWVVVVCGVFHNHCRRTIFIADCIQGAIRIAIILIEVIIIRQGRIFYLFHFSQLHCLLLAFLRPASHVQTTSDKFTKAFLVGKSVTRTQRPCTTPKRWGTSQVKVFGARLGFRKSLLESDTIRKSWMNIQIIIPIGNDGNQQYRTSQEQCEPELGWWEHLIGYTLVGVVKRTCIHGYYEAEVVYYTAPDCHMMEGCPIRHIQSTLEKKDVIWM